MLSKFKNLLITNWPIIVLLGLALILFKQNFISGTYLTGWDNLHPEFDFGVNIKRSIFAVWQEYQGLGLLGGMGHATDLIRQIFLWFLSIFLPENTLRYIWVFMTLFIGGVGSYFLSKYFLSKLGKEEKTAKIFALSGGLFYILNLATVQTYYVPFEAFIAHFAFLPWLLLSSVKYFLNEGEKSLLFLSIALLLSTPAAYIPTLFVTYLIAITVIAGAFLIFNFNTQHIKRYFKLLGVIFLINAFWLLPFLWFTLTSSGININSKINQMATESIFLQNKEFGGIFDVMLLKGFWFQNVDPNFQGLFTYMLNPWRDHTAKLYVQIIGYGIFAVVFLGFIKGLFSKKLIIKAFSILFIFAFTMLATTAPPFSWVNDIFRVIPLFDQAFRFPFTKFSILTALTYSIFFSIGLLAINEFINKRVKLNFLPLLFLTISTISMIVFVFPAFRLDLFYHKERLKIPEEYFRTFEFFRNQDQNTRIANLPQHTIWGWNFYSWGYGGSGFPWYGIKQPILDRAFDVWSPYDENYYWEISDALYSKDIKQFEDVVNKYQINWLLLDKNIINPQSPKALFVSEFESLISQISSVKKIEQFGNIVIYKVNLKDNPKSFVFDSEISTSVNKYAWTSDDRAYASFGNYTSSEDPSYYYPFRTLFSAKNEIDREFNAKEGRQIIEFSNELSDLADSVDLLIPPFLETEDTLPADILAEKNSDGSFNIYADIKAPEISIVRNSDKKEEEIWEKSHKYLIAGVSNSITFPLRININGANFELKSLDKNKYLGSSLIFLKQNNNVTLKDERLDPETIQIQGAEIITLFENYSKVINVKNIKKGDVLRIKTVKVNDNFSSFETWPSEKMEKEIGNCSNFRRGEIKDSFDKENKLLGISSENAAACISFYIPSLDHSRGYISFVQNRNINGRPLHYWLLNEDQKYAPIDTFVARNKSISSSYFVLPPQEQFGTGYSLHLENISIGRDLTANQFGKISLYPIPYKFISSLVFEINKPKSSQDISSAVKSVKHPNESLYVIRIDPSEIEAKTLVLSQGYDEGWSAYQMEQKPKFLQLMFPFVFGKKLDDHVQVNNWENGWILDQSSTDNRQSSIVIVFLPQYLQYIGFVLSLLTLGFVLFKTLKRGIKKLTQNNLSDKLSQYHKPAPDDTLIAP